MCTVNTWKIITFYPMPSGENHTKQLKWNALTHTPRIKLRNYSKLTLLAVSLLSIHKVSLNPVSSTFYHTTATIVHTGLLLLTIPYFFSSTTVRLIFLVFYWTIWNCWFSAIKLSRSGHKTQRMKTFLNNLAAWWCSWFKSPDYLGPA